MAHVALQMTALGGVAAEHCTGCERAFERGETMNAIEYENGEPAGWFCDDCIDYWVRYGQPRGIKGPEDEATSPKE